MRTRITFISLLLGAAALGACSTTEPDGAAAEPVLFPAPPAEPRLQYLGTLSKATDIEERSDFASLVVGQQQDHSLQRPQGTAWWQDRLYVCDPGAGTLLAFDFAAKELRRLLENQPGTLQKPLSIAIAPDGWKYVVDVARKLVVVLDAEDRFRATFGNPDEWRPVGIAADAESLYVTDVAEHRIVVLDRSSGAQTRVIGEGGEEPGQFYYPVEILLGPDGDLWVTDSFNFRVQRLRTDGTPVGSFGAVGKQPGNFARPKSVAVDRDGRAYVVDGAFENVQVFDADQRLLLYFGAPGGAPGSMNLPAHVTLSYEAAPYFTERVIDGYEIDYVLFVSNQLGLERVNVYGLLRPR